MDNPAVYDLIAKLISSLGFPIFVAVWLLVRTDKLLNALNTTMSLTKDTMQALLGEISATHEAMRVRVANLTDPDIR